MTLIPRAPRDRLYGLAAAFGLVFIVAGLNDPMVARAVATEPRSLHDIGIFVSRFGLSGYMLVISAAIVVGASWAGQKHVTPIFGLRAIDLAERAAYFFVAIAGSGITCQIIKHVLGRARPKWFGQYGAYHFEALTWRSAIDSFPSGHTTTAFAAAVAFTLFWPSGRIVFLAFAITIGVARILAGAHFPSDVVAGAALGSASALWLAHVFARRNIAFSMGARGLATKGHRASPSADTGLAS